MSKAPRDPVQITVTGRHLPVTDTIRDYAINKAGRLPRYFDRLKSVEILTDKQDSHNFEVEIIARVDRAEPFISKSIGHDLYACIDDAVDKTERQLARHKDRIRKH